MATSSGSAAVGARDTIASSQGARTPRRGEQVVTELETTIALNQAEPAIEPVAQKSTKKTTSKGAEHVRKSRSKTGAISEEEKRLARNAALREWRHAHADEVRKYMADWRSRRDAKKSEQPTLPRSAAPSAIATTPSAKKINPSTAKPSKTTKKSKAKKGGKG